MSPRRRAARIRRLRPGAFPPWRLRIDPYRVLYDLNEDDHQVIIHGVGEKPAIYQLLGEQKDEPE
jgi:mRNA-degrading endonuclease RelE of RelBE toxin-antitoxin system